MPPVPDGLENPGLRPTPCTLVACKQLFRLRKEGIPEAGDWNDSEVVARCKLNAY